MADNAHTKKVDAMVSAIVKELDEDIWSEIFGPHPEDKEQAKETKLKLRLVAIDHLPEESR